MNLSTHVFGRVLLFAPLFQAVDKALLDDSELFLSEPFRDLWYAFGLEVGFERPWILLLRREEGKKVFNTTLLERARQMVHRLIKQVSAEDDRDDAQRDIWGREDVLKGARPPDDVCTHRS